MLGTLTDLDGQPLVGVKVTLARAHIVALAVPFADAITNRAGAFRFGALPPGYYQLLLPSEKEGREVPELEAGDRCQVGTLRVGERR